MRRECQCRAGTPLIPHADGLWGLRVHSVIGSTRRDEVLYPAIEKPLIAAEPSADRSRGP